MQTAERLMDLLGWRFSKKPAKRLSMAKSFDALGVVFDMEYSQSCRIVVRNKPSRVEQIRNDIDMILQSGRFSTAAAMSLRGRLQFAESQTFGRAVMLHMRTCHQRAVGCVNGNMLTDSMMSELLWAKQFVLSCPPRILKGHVHGDRVLIFTDACLEDSNQIAGVGMVAYVWRGSKVAHKFFFSEKVPPGLLKHLQRDTPRVIAALELMAAVMAIGCLSHHLNAVRAFLFIDNEAARANLISMTSPVLVQAELLKELYQLAAKTSLFMWVSRVPSSKRSFWFHSTYPLHEAVKQGDAYITSKLLLFGADPSLKDMWGRSAYDYAMKPGHRGHRDDDIISILAHHRNEQPEFFANLEQDPLVQVGSREAHWLILRGKRRVVLVVENLLKLGATLASQSCPRFNAAVQGTASRGSALPTMQGVVSLSVSSEFMRTDFSLCRRWSFSKNDERPSFNWRTPLAKQRGVALKDFQGTPIDETWLME
eukprot:s3380_g2.t1